MGYVQSVVLTEGQEPNPVPLLETSFTLKRLISGIAANITAKSTKGNLNPKTFVSHPIMSGPTSVATCVVADRIPKEVAARLRRGDVDSIGLGANHYEAHAYA